MTLEQHLQDGESGSMNFSNIVVETAKFNDALATSLLYFILAHLFVCIDSSSIVKNEEE